MEESKNGRFDGWGDPLVVSTEQLRLIFLPLIEEQDEWKREYFSSYAGETRKGTGFARPLSMDYGRYELGERAKEGPLGGIENLAQELGVNARRVRKILNCEDKWIGLGLVDIWLDKLGLQNKMTDGSITVLPNQRWPREQWEAWSKRNGVSFSTEVGYF